MLVAKDFRRDAWAKLNGKRGVVAVCAVIQFLIFCVFGVAVYYIPYCVGEILPVLLTGSLAFGWALVSLNIAVGGEVSFTQFFKGFKELRAFLLGLLNTAFTFLWTLLLFVPGVIAALAYSMSYYILLDNPEMSANEARKASVEMMKGNKWRFFCLQCSFFGWYLLCVLTLGILSFWITPYAQTANALFYQNLLNERDQNGYGNYDENQPDADYGNYNPNPVNEYGNPPVNGNYGSYNGGQTVNDYGGYNGYNGNPPADSYGGYDENQPVNEYGNYNNNKNF